MPDTDIRIAPAIPALYTVIVTAALIVGVCVFGTITGNNDFYTLCIMCKIIAWITIASLVASFGYLALRWSDRSKDMFAYAIGFIYSKAPCTGSAHPVMNRIHGLIAYHAGLKFFMGTVGSAFCPAFYTNMKPHIN